MNEVETSEAAVGLRARRPKPQRVPPRDWDGLIVFCAGTPWDGNKFPDQHMAERLSAYAPVLYVDPPISRLTPHRIPAFAHVLEQPRLRLLGPRLARFTPVVVPAMGRPGVRRVAEAQLRMLVRGALRRMGNPSVRATVIASQHMLFGACAEQRKVLYATDDFAAAGELIGVSTRWLQACERRLQRHADDVVVISAPLADKWRARGEAPVLIPNGCDAELFAATDDAPLPDDVDLPPPIVGYVGHLSTRIDMALLEAVALRGHSLLLVGPRQWTFDVRRLDALLARENVQWVGARPFDALPSYLRVMDVGLLPYENTAFNRASFPLKTLEYLAAGRGAVATDLPAVRWLQTDLIHVADGPEAFAAAVDQALNVRRSPDLVARRRAFAAQHSWVSRAEEFAALLGLEERGRESSGSAA